MNNHIVVQLPKSRGFHRLCGLGHNDQLKAAFVEQAANRYYGNVEFQYNSQVGGKIHLHLHRPHRNAAFAEASVSFEGFCTGWIAGLDALCLLEKDAESVALATQKAERTDTVYAIGVKDDKGCFAMTHGPFPELSGLCETSPAPEDEDRSEILVFRGDADAETMYRRSNRRWVRVHKNATEERDYTFETGHLAGQTIRQVRINGAWRNANGE